MKGLDMQLEVGKKYRSRDGEVWECVRVRPDDPGQNVNCRDEQGNDYSFNLNGTFGGWDGQSVCDLIEEVEEAPTLPDTGDRTNFETGAVRDTMAGKGLPCLIPPEAIRRLARRFEDGAAKYGRDNWQKGIPLSRYQDAILRHTLAAAEGQTDEDHLGAVLWNAAAWIWTEDQIAAGNLPGSLNDLPYDQREVSHDVPKTHEVCV